MAKKPRRKSRSNSASPTSRRNALRTELVREALAPLKRKRLSYRFVPIEQSRTPTRRASKASDDRASPKPASAGVKMKAKRVVKPTTLDSMRAYVASHDPRSSPTGATCKERPRNNRSKGGGSKAFVPWCDAKTGGRKR